ncbi:hypothetical protein AGLY_006528 [Aphis glycines]|uniref:MD-2-related lipid-recognition domain-containing protein n=1 Tax=Aphis glycines TaxID=307491 RepID=A0A6G0TTM3_APHGL|nr:hypothetical protein AGLY_006528 [Aphis glycines]
MLESPNSICMMLAHINISRFHYSCFLCLKSRMKEEIIKNKSRSSAKLRNICRTYNSTREGKQLYPENPSTHVASTTATNETKYLNLSCLILVEIAVTLLFNLNYKSHINYINNISIPLFRSIPVLEIKLAEKDSFGKWKENAYMHKSPNACSSLKTLMGNSWTPFLNGAGFQDTNCPILPGIYIAPGFEVISIIKESKIPKIFAYGTYKINMWYTKKNEMFGCQSIVVENSQ